MKTKVISIAAIAIIAVGVIVWLWLKPVNPVYAPDISINTIDGKVLNFRSFAGKPLLISFWATTCSICLQEMPHLVDLYNELHHEGFEIIGIAMYYDPPNRVVEFSKQKNIPYSIALDIDGHAARAFGNVQVTPTSFLIGPEGTVIQRQKGELDVDKLRKTIKQILKTDGSNLS